MSNKETQDSLLHIRKMMEDSTRFMSLSGLSGIFIGAYALIAAAFTYWYLFIESNFVYFKTDKEPTVIITLGITFGITLVLSLATGFILSKRKAKTQGTGFWNKSAKKLMINLAIPLATGAMLCLVLAYYNMPLLASSITLIFYGLALINASHYTIKEIKALGILEIIIGFIAAFNIGYGLYFWALGFGVLHIIYGIVIYLKYDRKS